MKKFILSALCSLAILPNCGVANTLDSLFTSGIIFKGPCGEPPAVTVKNPNFCTCLINESVAECKRQGLGSACTEKRVIESYSRVPNHDYHKFCGNFQKLFPKDASGDRLKVEECETDLAYYNAQCL